MERKWREIFIILGTPVGERGGEYGRFVEYKHEAMQNLFTREILWTCGSYEI